MTQLTQNQSITDRLILPTGVTTAIRSLSTDGSVQHLLVTVGAQWDLAPAFTLGALLTSPGLRIGGGSQIQFSQTVFQAAGLQNDLAFRDSDAKFDYKIPVRATAGATFRYSKGQVELDVRYFGAQDEYDLLSSDSLAGRQPGPLDRELRPGCQLLPLSIAPAARRGVQRSLSRERAFAIELPGGGPHRGLGRRLTRVREADSLAWHLLLVGNDDGASGRPHARRVAGDE